MITVQRALQLATVSAVARIPGFLIPVLVAAFFGASDETDAYFIAYSIVLLVGGALAQSVEVAIVPFAAREAARGGNALHSFLGRAAKTLLWIAVAAWLVVVPAILWGTSRPLRGAVVLYSVCFIGLLAWAPCSAYAGALVARDDIGAATGSLLWRGVGGVGGLGLGYLTGVGLIGVAIGLGVGEVLRLWWVRTRVLHAEQSIPTRQVSGNIGSFRGAAAAMLIAGAMGGLVVVVERLLATSVGPGSVSRLEYATRVLVIPAVIFEGAIAPVFLGKWSREAVNGEPAPRGRELFRKLAFSLGVAVSFGLVLALTAPGIVMVLLRHGRFTAADTEIVSTLLRWLSVGFVGTMGALMAERAFLATGRSGVIARLTVVRVTARIAVAIILLRPLGLKAFAIGYAAGEWAYFFLLMNQGAHELRPMGVKAAPAPQ